MKGSIRSLEEILQECFRCKRPLRSKPVKYCDSDENVKEDYLTKVGWKAYGKLVCTVYALETVGAIDNADDVIETLDEIASNRN